MPAAHYGAEAKGLGRARPALEGTKTRADKSARRYGWTMRLIYFLGWALLVAAFLAAALDVGARALGAEGGLWISAHDLWYTYRPGNLVVTQILVERHLHPLLWDPVAVTVLALPAWALFGIPGGALIWFFRPPRLPEPDIDEDRMLLFDALAKRAEEEGFDDEDPGFPGGDPFGDYDPIGATIAGPPSEALDGPPPDADEGDTEDGGR